MNFLLVFRRFDSSGHSWVSCKVIPDHAVLCLEKMKTHFLVSRICGDVSLLHSLGKKRALAPQVERVITFLCAWISKQLDQFLWAFSTHAYKGKGRKSSMCFHEKYTVSSNPNPNRDPPKALTMEQSPRDHGNMWSKPPFFPLVPLLKWRGRDLTAPPHLACFSPSNGHLCFSLASP